MAQTTSKIASGWVETVLLPHVRTATLLAGPLFVVAYALGLVSYSKFLGRYGLQATELLRGRYLSIGLSTIVLIAPTVICLNVFTSLAQRMSLAGEKMWLTWLTRIMLAVVCGAVTSATWLCWFGILTSSEPGVAVRTPPDECLAVGLAAGAAALVSFFLPVAREKTWMPLMALLWSLLVCTSLSNVL